MALIPDLDMIRVQRVLRMQDALCMLKSDAHMLPLLQWQSHELARADLFSQLQLSVMESLQPELVSPGGRVGVAPQHKGCHQEWQALLVGHCPGHIQCRVFMTPQGCAHPVKDVLAIAWRTLQIALQNSI